MHAGRQSAYAAWQPREKKNGNLSPNYRMAVQVCVQTSRDLLHGEGRYHCRVHQPTVVLPRAAQRMLPRHLPLLRRVHRQQLRLVQEERIRVEQPQLSSEGALVGVEGGLAVKRRDNAAAAAEITGYVEV